MSYNGSAYPLQILLECVVLQAEPAFSHHVHEGTHMPVTARNVSTSVLSVRSHGLVLCGPGAAHRSLAYALESACIGLYPLLSFTYFTVFPYPMPNVKC